MLGRQKSFVSIQRGHKHAVSVTALKKRVLGWYRELCRARDAMPVSRYADPALAEYGQCRDLGRAGGGNGAGRPLCGLAGEGVCVDLVVGPDPNLRPWASWAKSGSLDLHQRFCWHRS